MMPGLATSNWCRTYMLCVRTCFIGNIKKIDSRVMVYMTHAYMHVLVMLHYESKLCNSNQYV